MEQKIVRCQNKDCIWWEDYSCSKKLITINKEGICSEVARKKSKDNNKSN